jgi:transposase
VSRR